MKAQYNILMSLKTVSGFEDYGQYFLGNDKHAAYALFDQLNGDESVPEAAPLHLDLIELMDELPVSVKTKSCTLEELACNTKIIAREIFRRRNLEEMN